MPDSGYPCVAPNPCRRPSTSTVDLTDTRRQVILGSVLEASAGDRVAVLAPTLADAHQFFTDTLHGLDQNGLSVSTVSRRESLGFPGGGRIQYESLRGSSRGRSYDVVYVSKPVSESQLAEILPALDASPDGRLYLY